MAAYSSFSCVHSSFKCLDGIPLPVGINAAYSALGGTIPNSDAGGYLNGGHTFNQLGFLDNFNTRRPLNALFLPFG